MRATRIAGIAGASEILAFSYARTVRGLDIGGIVPSILLCQGGWIGCVVRIAWTQRGGHRTLLHMAKADGIAVIGDDGNVITADEHIALIIFILVAGLRIVWKVAPTSRYHAVCGRIERNVPGVIVGILTP